MSEENSSCYQPEASDVVSAYELIKDKVKHTPVHSSASVNALLGATLFFKCENFQKVGAFKYRGATHAVLKLNDEEARKGVATHSSGNHAAALALAAANRGIPAYIVMPENAPAIKKKAVAGYGGIITYCRSTQQDREETLRVVQQQTGATLIHPYNNINVICGQGTAALELLDEMPDLDVVIAPVGGGGLLSGTATFIKGQYPHVKVFGAEPINADDAFRSLRDGKIYPSLSPSTIADGLLTSLCPLTYSILRSKCDGIFTVSEKGIVNAMRLIWERMKLVVEPSSAVPVGVIAEHPEAFRGKRVGIIVSGGNADLDHLPWLDQSNG
ncbi:MAG: pyridoxal-phosphate dependent enzyme [Bacteroidales bacterium]|nr:pyridoxal-phosphate dependent enzyme [Bacteroidales bacterium]HPG99627.1 pyridoxal-phosphate dependent enzyme [Tenuifilaceae bacterium]HPM90274.1 pyridoxal-phosphate dependent enzyme [Tenuifilaceae bacterium]